MSSRRPIRYSVAKTLEAIDAAAQRGGIRPTVAALAALAGVSPRQIWRWRAGDCQRLNPTTADRISDRLDIYVGLLEEPNPRHQERAA